MFTNLPDQLDPKGSLSTPMAKTKTKRNLPRQCRREDATTPPSTPIEDERSTRLEGHEEDQRRSRRRRTRRRSQAFSKGRRRIRRRMRRSPMKVTKKQQWRGRRGRSNRNREEEEMAEMNRFFFKLISPGVHLSFPLNCWVHQQ